MSSHDEPSTLAIAHRFFDAYNRSDTDALDDLVADDVRWGHHNRFSGNGKAGMLESIGEVAETMLGRRFGDILRWAGDEQQLYCEHTWTAFPAADVPDWGWHKDVPVTFECISCFRFEDGRITEWFDYG